MAENQIVVSSVLDTSQFEAGANRLIKLLNEVQASFNKLGQQQGAAGAGKLLDSTSVSLNAIRQRVEAVNARLLELKRIQDQVATRGFGRATQPAGLVSEAGKPLHTGDYIGKTGAGADALARGIAAANKEAAELATTMEATLLRQEENAVGLANKLPEGSRAALSIDRQRLEAADKLSNIASGKVGQSAAKRELENVIKLRQEAEAYRESLKAGRISELPKATAARITGGEVAAQRLANKEALIRDYQQDELELAQKIRAVRQTDSKEGLADLQKRRADLKANLDLAQKQAAALREPAARGKSQAAGAFGLGNLDQDLAALDQYIDSLKGLQGDLESGEGAGAMRKEFDNLQIAAQQVEGSMARLKAKTSLTAAEERKLVNLTKEQAILNQRAVKLQERAAAAGTKQLDFQGQAKKVTRLEKTLTGAFEGFGRRFEATLQFAISGALIFGVQRLAREFIQAAIDVERAFADIQTALEFDIDAPRGTAAFTQQVDSVRLKILQVADEFNVLPTEANAAAFVMVSRFGDVDNALKAVRAQLLATKVSGIDQTEVLRALTAVAEGFAGAIFEVNDALTIQEKLMKREAISANLYAEALDLAVYVQQKFGIETEDVLEGTARATEVFRIMGFTMQETAALVSSVSRELGQTGVQASEKLVRSIGQLTAPQVKDELLGLAEASSAFFLTETDFSSGARAWRAIADQFDRIQQTEPGVAAAILQIVGQRREAEAVAAALGTIDLQQAIVSGADDAAGAAERRYSFLVATVSEKIQSIVVAFQELAQNVERLGLLTPLKVLLSGLDGVLTAINFIIKAVDKMVSAFDKIRVELPFTDKQFGLGDVLKTATAIGLALRGAKVLLGAGAGAASTLTRFGEESAKVGGGSSAVAAIAAGKALERLVFRIKDTGGVFAALKILLMSAYRGLGTVLAGLVTKLYNFGVAVTTAQASSVAGAQGFGAKVAVLGAKLLPAAAAAGAVATVLYNLRAAAVKTRQAFESVQPARAAGAQAARDAAAAGASRAEQEVARYRAEIDTLTASFEEAGPALSGFQIALASLFPSVAAWLATQEIRIPETELGKAYGAGGTIFDPEGENLPDVDALIEARRRALEQIIGTDEWRDRLIRAATGQWIKGSLEALSDVLASASVSPGALDAIFGEDFELFDRYRRIRQKIAGALSDLNEAIKEDDPERIALAEAYLLELSSEGTEIKAQIEEFYRGVEATIEGTASVVEQAERDLSLGRTTEGAVRAAREKAIRTLEKQLELVGDGAENEEKRRKIQAEIDKYEQAQIDDRIAFYDEKIAEAELITNEETQYILKLEALKAQWRELKDPAERRAKLREIKELTKEYYESLQTELESIKDSPELKFAERALSGASNVNEQLAALDRIKKVYAKVIAQMVLQIRSTLSLFRFMQNIGPLIDAMWELQGYADQTTGILNDQKQRLAAANARLNGPILNKMNQINGEIAALNLKLASSDTVGADRAEAQVALSEKYVEQVQETNRRIGSSLLAAAGVTDTIGQLNAQLSIAKEGMLLAAKYFGQNSAEYHDADLALQQLQKQLGDAETELNILTARLKSDLTNPYEQAAIDAAAALDALNVPGLGELEKKRAEYAYEQAKIAEDSTKLDSQLFQLKYLYETDQLGVSGYISALQSMLNSVDTGTTAGKQAFLEIQGLIDGLADDASDLAFNIPTSIRIPTLFEVRRALAADQLGVNYQDNRQQDVRVYVSNEVDASHLIAELDDLLGTSISQDTRRNAPGGAPLTLGVY